MKPKYTYLDARFELGRTIGGPVFHTPDHLVANRGNIEIRVSDQDGPLSGGSPWAGMTWRVEVWSGGAKIGLGHSTNWTLPSLRAAVVDTLREAATLASSTPTERTT